MEIPPFTIIYRSPAEAGDDDGPAAGAAARAGERLTLLGDFYPQAAASLKTLNPKLRRTLVDSSCEVSATPLAASRVDFGKVVQTLRPVLDDLERAPKVETVAVWDLDANVAGLPCVIAHLNRAQTAFTFFCLQAPMPAGLVARRENFFDWADSRRGPGQRILKEHAEAFDNNLMSNDFYKHARVVHNTLGMDYMVGVTRHMIAGYERGQLFWNYFAASSRPILLVSAYNLCEYAREAGRPFEVAVAGIIVSQLLMDANRKAGATRLKYHDDTGCVFDFNESRDSIATSIREAKIDPECLKKMRPRYRKPAAALVEALKSYTPDEADDEEAPAPASSSAKKHDDYYWLGQLSKLRKSKKG